MAAGRASQVAVEAEDLTVAYGERIAVDGVSFTAEPGEVLAILGPNGAGKTTTVETLEGYRSPTSGRVRVLGHDPVSERASVVSRIGVVLQRGGLYPMMNADRALRLFAAYYPNPRDPSELVASLGLAEVAKTPYKRLSGGEQQRLALALAVVGRPEVAFLDEPTAGVDPAGRAAVRDLVADLKGEGVCIVLTSHELDEVERLADRVVIIDHGHVVAAGRPEEIGGGEGEIRFAAATGLDTAALAAVMSAVVTEPTSGHYRVEAVPSPEAVARLANWLGAQAMSFTSLEAGRERLEDVFLRLIKSESSAN